ncbi:MAG TPA: hypothetical protein VMT29_03040, partial [Steroidobacteraceae bacterium]|nr:hypothetical protein [Steroidobacteraceae bacterium]
MRSDRFSYLEDILAGRTQTWIQAQNERTAAALEQDPRFQTYYRQLLSSVDAHGALGNADSVWTLSGSWVYQVWSDSERHPKGIWRRTTLRSLLAARPRWQILLDLDHLSESDGRPWILRFVQFAPNGHRCMLGLSDGGSMTLQWREFDVEAREFPDDGFRLPKALGANVAWWSNDSLLVATDTGAGSIADTGFPMVVRKWDRKRSVDTAPIILKGRHDGPSLVGVWSQDDSAATGKSATGKSRRNRTVVISGSDYDWWQYSPAGKLQRMTLPPVSSPPVTFAGRYVFRAPSNSDWTVGDTHWAAGSLLSIPVQEIGRKNPTVEKVFELLAGEVLLGTPAVVKGGMVALTTNAGSVSARRVRLVRGHWEADPIPLPAGLIRETMSDAGYGSDFVTLENDLLP